MLGTRGSYSLIQLDRGDTLHPVPEKRFRIFIMMPHWFLVLLLPLVVKAGPTYVRILPQDCHDLQRSGVNRSGVYTIYPSEDSPIQVYCDMGCDEDEHRGWTVFQRRMDGSVNFYRPWEQYKNGFGNLTREHWLGLDNLHKLTENKHYELGVDMEDFEGKKAAARYTIFSVGSESSGYVLQVGGFTGGNAGDALSNHNGYRFSTFDKDHTPSYYNYNYYYYYYNYYYYQGCPSTYLGGFWYNYCHQTNPNGVYMWGNHNQFAAGIVWVYWRGYYYSLKSITMKIIPVS